MEFSFDRSNTLHSNAGTAAAAAEEIRDEIDTSTIANERLKKAIERNRARQAERTRHRPEVQNQKMGHERPVEQQNTLFDKPQESEQVVHPPQSSRNQEKIPLENEVRASTNITRRSVARANEADFTPAKRSPKKVSGQISYSTTSSRKKSKSIDPAIIHYLVKGSWIFCAILVLRLLFANGGVSDFYSQHALINDRLTELDRIKKENMQLVQEIERMQTDSNFQKKLVRDNLGFIASDEFLILFPKENLNQ